MLGARAREGGVKEGQKLRVLTAAAGLGHMQPLRVIISGDSGVEAAAALSDTGNYVPVDIRNVDADVAEKRTKTTATTTAAACGSIRASTRRRCATTFPPR